MKESGAEHNQRNQLQAGSLVDKLLKIAGEAQGLAFSISSESETYRTAVRLGRLAEFTGSELTDREVGAFATAYVDLTIQGNNLFTDHPIHFFVLNLAIAQVSSLTWEELWNEKHPDRYGKAWEDQDFDLMDVWREKVRGMLKRCGQDAVLGLTAEEYATQLIGAGASEQAVDSLRYRPLLCRRARLGSEVLRPNRPAEIPFGFTHEWSSEWEPTPPRSPLPSDPSASARRHFS